MTERHDVADPPSALTGLHHVRLTVTGIEQSKTFQDPGGINVELVVTIG